MSYQWAAGAVVSLNATMHASCSCSRFIVLSATMNLAGAFSDSVQKHSEKTALFWGDTTFTYSELWSRSLFVSGILRHQFNVLPGDRVALWLKNCPEFIPALFGILQIGAVVVPINNFLKPDEVAYILNDAGIDTIITDGEL